MKKNKNLILGIGIFNFLIFILITVIPNVMQNKFLTITNNKLAFLLLILSFLPLYISFFVLKLKKKSIKFDGKTIVSIMLFGLFSLFYLVVLNLYIDVFESRTTNIDNYMILDEAFKYVDMSFFPKNISKNAQDVKYSYRYWTVDENNWNSDFDVYLELTLPVDEYILEKERIKEITYFEQRNNTIYLNSSEEYIKYYGFDGVIYDEHEELNYYFVSFFDDEYKIIYNFTFGFFKPYFITINEENMVCEKEICKID